MIWVQSTGPAKGLYKHVLEEHAKGVVGPGTKVEIYDTGKDRFADTAYVKTLVGVHQKI